MSGGYKHLKYFVQKDSSSLISVLTKHDKWLSYNLQLCILLSVHNMIYLCTVLPMLFILLFKYLQLFSIAQFTSVSSPCKPILYAMLCKCKVSNILAVGMLDELLLLFLTSSKNRLKLLAVVYFK